MYLLGTFLFDTDKSLRINKMEGYLEKRGNWQLNEIMWQLNEIYGNYMRYNVKMGNGQIVNRNMIIHRI